MAVTVTDLRTTRADADSLTGWSSSASIDLFTANPPPVEESGHIGAVVSNTRAYVIHTTAAVNLTNTLVYVWVLPGPAMASKANDGFGIVLGDGTNRIQFEIGGNDESAFRHNTGNPPYVCMAVDTANLPRGFAHNGSVGNLNLSSITEIGMGCQTTLKAVGGVANVFTDVIRYGNGGLRIAGGTSSDPGTFDDISALDASTATGRAHGIVRRLGTGLYGTQGSLVFGDAGSSWFEVQNGTLVFEDRGFAVDKYVISIEGANAVFRLGTKVGTGPSAIGADGFTFVAPPGLGAAWQADPASEVLIYGSLLSGFSQGLSFGSSHEVIGCQIVGGGVVELAGTTAVNTTFGGSVGSTAVLWDVTTNPDGRLDGCSFVSGASGHGIELGPNCPGEITLRGIGFTGYGADGTTNASLYNNSGKHIVVNIVGGSTPTVRNGAGATTELIADPRTFSFEVRNEAGDPVTGYEWRLYVDDPTEGTLGTEELAGEEYAVSSSQSYQYVHEADIDVVLQILHTDYVEFILRATLINADQSPPVTLTPEENV